MRKGHKKSALAIYFMPLGRSIKRGAENIFISKARTRVGGFLLKTPMRAFFIRGSNILFINLLGAYLERGIFPP